MISLWILLGLTILTLTVSQQVALGLRLSRYQQERLKAYAQAKAAVNQAIRKIEQDGMAESAVDEERKININTASPQLLLALLEHCRIDSPDNVVNAILIWRGGLADTNNIYEELGYPAKGSQFTSIEDNKFTNIEELNLVKGISSEEYQKLSPLITVYGKGLININTASEEVLRILLHSIAKELKIKEEGVAESILTDIIVLRDTKQCFIGLEEISSGVIVTGAKADIFTQFLNRITLQSNNFLIEVSADAGKIKSKISAVYNRAENRADKKILSWYES